MTTEHKRGLNPAAIYIGDLKLRNIVHTIHASRARREVHNAIGGHELWSPWTEEREFLHAFSLLKSLEQVSVCQA